MDRQQRNFQGTIGEFAACISPDKVILSEVHNVVVESARRDLFRVLDSSDATVNNDVATENTAEINEDLTEWMTTKLYDALLFAHAKALNEDPTTYAENQKKLLQNTQAVLNRSVHTALSSVSVTNEDEKSKTPKIWGAFAQLEWFNVDQLSYNSTGEKPLYDDVEVESRMFFQGYSEGEKTRSDDPKSPRDHLEVSENTKASDPEVVNVVRMSKWFTIYELGDERDKATEGELPFTDSLYSLGKCLYIRTT